MKRSAVLIFGLYGITCPIYGCGDTRPTAINTTHEQAVAAPRVANNARAEIKPINTYVGTITAIGPDWLEIAAGWKMANQTWAWNTQGKQLAQETNYDNSKSKRLSASGTWLVNGRADGSGNDESYVISEIQIRDRVSICSGYDNLGQERVTQILILRRPDGMIPLLPPDVWGNPSYQSARHQAEQDWEEHRIPIPPQYLDKNGQYPWTNPPYMPLPVAPPPRPVKP